MVRGEGEGSMDGVRDGGGFMDGAGVREGSWTEPVVKKGL